jgi:predicted nucleic acid-binding protein
VLVLDSGGVSRLAQRSTRALALIAAFRQQGLWPPLVPSVVLVESLTGRGTRDANVNRLVKTCDVAESVPQPMARRAAELRHRARRGSAVDAVTVAAAEPGGTVLTSDPKDLEALAAHATAVTIERA